MNPPYKYHEFVSGKNENTTKCLYNKKKTQKIRRKMAKQIGVFLLKTLLNIFFPFCLGRAHFLKRNIKLLPFTVCIRTYPELIQSKE